MDGLVGNSGFDVVTDRCLRAAREASEVVGALEHRAALENRDTEQWLALEGLLRRRLLAYIDSHEDEFFVDSDEAAATAERVRATFAERDEWVTQTIEKVDRAVEAQEWLVQGFGERGIYSEASALLLLRPDDMRQALDAATQAGYEPQDLAFFAHVGAPAQWETIEADPVGALVAGAAHHAAAWVGVELQ